MSKTDKLFTMIAMKKTKFEYIFLVPILLSLLAGIWIPTHNPVPVQQLQAAAAGQLDVSEWDTQSVVELQGEWYYYGDALIQDLSQNQIDNQNQPEPRAVTLPHLFPPREEQGGNAYGVATYQLVLKGLKPEQDYGIQVIDIATAYRMLVNGSQVLSAGQVSDDPAKHDSMMLEQVGFFRSDARGQAEILLEVSNFSYFEGGFRNFITFGTAMQINRYSAYQELVEIFLYSTILILGLFYLGVYTIYRRFPSLLYFSLLSILNANRVLLRGHRQIYDFIPQLPWDLAVRLEFLMGYLALPAFGMFIFSMDYGKRRAGFLFFYVGFTILSVLLCFLAPNQIYANLLPYYIRLMQVFMVYFIIVLVRGIMDGRRDAILIAVTSLFLFAGALYDYFIRGFNAMVPIAIYTMTIILTVIVTNQIRLQSIATANLAERLQVSLTEEQKLRERLEALDRIKDEFLANTSHELRTPLNSIINLTESVLQRGREAISRLQEENLELVVASGKRLLRLINDLLDSTRIRHQDLAIEKRDLHLSAVIGPVLQVFRSTTDSSRVIYHTTVPDDLMVLADENRLIQILYNLLGNAQRFTAHGSITISAEPSGKQAMIMVEDTGKGISGDRLDLIMNHDEERQLERLQDQNLLGIGLPITRQLVKLMGGEFWIESEEYEGTRCFFTLPLATGSPRATESILNLQSESRTEPRSQEERAEQVPPLAEEKAIKVLVVDDEYVNLRTILSVLAPDGYTFLTATSGQEALELISGNQDLSLVILDVMLPGLSGHEVCRKIRELFSVNELPVLMMTAARLDHDVAMGLSSGANDFLNKPFSSEELRARVKSLINMKANHDFALSNEIAFLHAQIKPHFLHNVLNTLSHLTVENPAQAEQLVENFSVYLRNNFEFYDLESQIPLEKELETIEAYIAIEKQRFGDRIQYECHIQDEVREQRLGQILIPPLILQPLVENSVRHGISKKIGGGKITLDIRLTGEGITFTVADDGVGMTEDLVGLVMAGQKPGSVGIRNINTRLRRTYGTTLECHSAEGQGTQISFTIRKG